MVAHNAGGVEELLRKERRGVFPWPRAAQQLLLLCTGCIRRGTCCDSADSHRSGDDPGVLEPLACLRHCWVMLSVPVSGGITLNWAICKTARSCPFLSELFCLIHESCIKHYLSTFQKSFYFCLSWAVTRPLNWCTLLKQSFLILRCTVILLRFHHKEGVFLVPLTV